MLQTIDWQARAKSAHFPNRPFIDGAYVDSLSAVSADGYRFVDHPDYVATFRATFAKVEALPCEILITPHPGASTLFARLADPATLANPESCRAYAAGARMRLADRLASESTPPK